MRRRDFIVGVGSAVGWPLVAAQQQTLPVIGWLNRSAGETAQVRLRAFRQSLTDAGFIEGRNVAIEYRWGDGGTDRLRKDAADLVGRRVSLIVAGSDSAALAAKRE